MNEHSNSTATESSPEPSVSAVVPDAPESSDATTSLTQEQLRQPEAAVTALPAYAHKLPPAEIPHATLWAELLAGGIDEPLTWQVFCDDKSASASGSTRPMTFRGSLARERSTLARLNEAGDGIFVVVNKTDPTASSAQTKRGVVGVRANFSDDDYNLRRSDPLPPHMVVESKAGPHTYWLCDPAMSTDEWIEVQWIIAWVKQTDPQMVNLDRVLRMPGSIHRKDPKNPVLVTVAHYDPPGSSALSPRRYTFADWCSVRPPLTDAERHSLQTWYAFKKQVKTYFEVPELESHEWTAMLPLVRAWMQVQKVATRKVLRDSRSQLIENGHPGLVVEPPRFDQTKPLEHWRAEKDWWRVREAFAKTHTYVDQPAVGSPGWEALLPKALTWMKWVAAAGERRKAQEAAAAADPSYAWEIEEAAFDPAKYYGDVRPPPKYSGKYDSSEDDEALSWETMLTTDDGQSGTVGEFAENLENGGEFRCLCPFHESSSGHNNAALYKKNNGVLLKCWTGCSIPFLRNERVPHVKRPPFAGSGAPQGSDAVWRVPELPSASEAPALLVKAPMGSGKTTATAQYLTKVGGPFVLVVPTQALAAAAAAKYGIKSYANTTGTIYPTESIVVCAPSLTRISPYTDACGAAYAKLSCVVIEESEQTFSIMESDAIMRRGGKSLIGPSFSRLRVLCQHARQVIALDANASERTERNLQRLTSEELVTVLEAPVSAPTSWSTVPETAYMEACALREKMFDDARAGKEIYVFAPSATDVKALAAEFKAMSCSVLTIHGDSTPDERATMTDVNTSWTKYQVVICNDAAGSGISYDRPGRHVYVFGTSCGPRTQWTSLLQGVARVRNPASVSSWVDDRKYDHELDLEGV